MPYSTPPGPPEAADGADGDRQTTASTGDVETGTASSDAADVAADD